MFSIKEVAEYYGINTNTEGCSITPLHYLFAKYIVDQAKVPKLLEKMKEIDFGVTNIKELVQLRSKSYDPRRI